MDASMTPDTKITDGQKDAIKALLNGTAADIITEVLKEDKRSAQRFLANGDEFRTIIFDAVRKVASDQFADEETSSSHIYPEDYQILPIEEQVAKLQELFPELNGADLEIAKGELPEGAEGWFAIPRWDKVGQTYNAAVEAILAKLGKSRKFYNYRDGELSEKHLRQNERTIEMWQTLCDQQEGHDIIIVPAQFGLRHRGRSVRRAHEIFSGNEFGLGIFATCCMLLVHPKRLQRWEQLHWDCAGDDYDWRADGRWACCPCLFVDDDEVELDAYRLGNVCQHFGSASAFLGSVDPSS